MYLAVTTSKVTAPVARHAIVGTLQHVSSTSRESVIKGITVSIGIPSLLPQHVATAVLKVARAHVVEGTTLLEVLPNPRRVLKQHRRTRRLKTVKGKRQTLQDK